MTATAIFGPSATAGLSSVVSLAAGATCNFVVGAPGGAIPHDAIVDILIACSNGTKTLVKQCRDGDWTCSVAGPGDYYANVATVGRAGTVLTVDKNI